MELTKGKQKLFWLSEALSDLIDEYSRRTGLSKSKVVAELCLIGDSKFREKYGLGEEDDEPVVESEESEEKKDVGLQLSKAYWKKIMKYEDNELADGWTAYL
jgi:hypothetical protein